MQLIKVNATASILRFMLAFRVILKVKVKIRIIKYLVGISNIR